MSNLRIMFQKSGKTCLEHAKIYGQFMQIRKAHPIDRNQAKTALLMVYPGGPKCEEDISCFVKRILTNDFLHYGCLKKTQKWTESKWILPEMYKRYESIGNVTPQFAWMLEQAKLVEERMDLMCTDTYPHKAFLGCQFVKPSIFDALRSIHQLPNLRNIVILPMYPQFSCGLTGGCFHSIFNFYKKNPLPEGVKWAVVDTWATTYSLIKNAAYLIRKALVNCDLKKKPYTLVFAARPMAPMVFDVGDFYPYLVGSTVMHVMRHVGVAIPYTIAYHDGPLLDKWMEPTVEDTIKNLVCKGKTWFMLVPISTVVENINTYYDYDKQLKNCFLPSLGDNLHLLRIAAPNASELFITSVAQVCKDALTKVDQIPIHMRDRCVCCQNNKCSAYKKWFRKVLTERRIVAIQSKTLKKTL